MELIEKRENNKGSNITTQLNFVARNNGLRFAQLLWFWVGLCQLCWLDFGIFVNYCIMSFDCMLGIYKYFGYFDE